MVTVRVECSFEDYIIDDWMEDHNYTGEDIEDHIYDFVDEYFSTTPDHVEIL